MKTPAKTIWFATVLAALTLFPNGSRAPAQPASNPATLFGRVVLPAAVLKSHPPSIVVWLTATGNSPTVPEPHPGQFKLVQKDRMFAPHLLVVPVGSIISFPNEDPFFHNVFSLFNGKRFDLGLYEAGSTREVSFSRQGVSYIFCNIHPEMSAVVIALATPLYAVADRSGSFSIPSIAPGVYELHVWIEGTPQPDLDRLSRRIAVEGGQSAGVTINASSTDRPAVNHLNKFGKPYQAPSRPPY